MQNKLRLTLNKTLHDMAILDLRLQNGNEVLCDLTYNDIMYLDIISAHPGKYTSSNIADMLFVSRPAVTQKINELERKGYIYKKQNKTDKRAYFLFINTDGEHKDYYDYIDKIDELVFEKLKKEYSKEEIDVFFEISNKISDLMSAQGKAGEK